MFIQMKNIQKLFSNLPNRIVGECHISCISNFCILSQDFSPIFSEHCVYVAKTPEFIKVLPANEKVNLIILTEKMDDLKQNELPPDSCVLILQTTDFHNVCRTLTSFFDDNCGVGLMTDSLLEILFFESGIQAMLDKIHPAFLNPIYVFDANFNLLAATPDSAADTRQGPQIVKNGGFTQEEFDILNLTHIHRKMAESDYPIRSVHPVAGYEQMLCTIDTEKDMGHIVLNGLNRPLTDTDARMLYILKKAIDQQMKKDEFIRNNKGFHYEYFFRDLLDGKMAVGNRYKDRMTYVDAQFSGNLYCMVIETARSSHTLNTSHIRSCFENEFPGSMTLMYHGGIIVLFKLPAQTFFVQKDYDKIADLCQKYGLYAGMGNCFQSILHVTEYYLQGLRSIELGICKQNEPDLYLYKDYYLSHLAAIFTQKESADTFCHPQLYTLMEYDRENNTDYARILYTWLINERNIAATADALYMHRNTLVYRLKKINALVSADYDSYLERQHIILSYELFQR